MKRMDTQGPQGHWESSLWYRVVVLRWVYEYLIRRGVWYVKFDGTEEQFWRQAMRCAPPSYRWLNRSLSVQDVDAELEGWRDWENVKEIIQPGDRIWPFLINPWTSALRGGYVVVRRGKPVAGVVTLVS